MNKVVNSHTLNKQAQLFQLTGSMRYSPMDLCKKLGELEYEECLPSMPYGTGWISPIDEDVAPLVQSINGHIMICLQIEKKYCLQSLLDRNLLKKLNK